MHRDVKPDNILLEKSTGRALVTDFGIAHGGEDTGPSVVPAKIMGTVHFMSPEQASGDQLDGRSDIYALGVVGYLAVSGRLPFETTEPPALMLQQATETPRARWRSRPGCRRRSPRRSTSARARSRRPLQGWRGAGGSAGAGGRNASGPAPDPPGLAQRS